MADIHSEPKPGTAFKTIMEENLYLDEFMTLVKKKLDLDRQHLNDLKALRTSWNPKWTNSSIWPLVSPLLEYFKIHHWEEAGKDMESRLTMVPVVFSPESYNKEAPDLLEVLEELEPLYDQSQEAKKAVNTPNSLRTLKIWYDTMQDSRTNFVDRRLLLLPIADRNYRKAVVLHQRKAAQVSEWLIKTLPKVLEAHQQRAEDIKQFLHGVLNSYSKFISHFLSSCTRAVGSITCFSSTNFIGPRHDERDLEVSHALAQGAVYCNYMLGGRVARPLFGVDPRETMTLIESFDKRGIFQRSVDEDEFLLRRRYIQAVFDLEAQYSTNPVLSTVIKEVTSTEGYSWAYEYAFYCDDPLIQISATHKDQYRNGIRRRSLADVLTCVSPMIRPDVISLMIRCIDRGRASGPTYDSTGGVAPLFTADPTTRTILKDIWRKWDVKRDGPLPGGIERVWSEFRKISVVTQQRFPFTSQYTLTQWERDSTIVENLIPENRRARIYFAITSPTPGLLRIAIRYNDLQKSIREFNITIEDLLDMLGRADSFLDLEYVKLNPSGLLKLVSKKG